MRFLCVLMRCYYLLLLCIHTIIQSTFKISFSSIFSGNFTLSIDASTNLDGIIAFELIFFQNVHSFTILTNVNICFNRRPYHKSKCLAKMGYFSAGQLTLLTGSSVEKSARLTDQTVPPSGQTCHDAK